MITIMINDHWQGRIQDMKLGMAQMDWKNWKPGDGGALCYIYFKYQWRPRLYRLYIDPRLVPGALIGVQGRQQESLTLIGARGTAQA